MSKTKKAATAPAAAADPVAPADDAVTLQADPAPDGPTPDPADPGDPPADDAPPDKPESNPPPAAATVRALVLSDSPFGRCGEVREFDAAHAGTIEAGGFIDTHPNAVASAESEA